MTVRTGPALTLAIRPAEPADARAAVRLLADAYAGGETACWLVPDPGLRPAYSLGLVQVAVEHALRDGVVHVAADRGAIIGAALWIPHPGPADRQPDRPTGGPAGDTRAAGVRPAGVRAVLDRRRHLDRLLQGRHPGRAHHHLTHLAVRPDRRGHGVGSLLLLYHHAFLHTLGMGAYLDADTPASHDLFGRHGYSSIGPPLLLPGTGIPVWPMWRPSSPARHLPSPHPAGRTTRR